MEENINKKSLGDLLDKNFPTRKNVPNKLAQKFSSTIDTPSVSPKPKQSLAKRIVGGVDTALYTSVSEGGQQKFRKGDGIANLLARQLNLMKQFHEEERQWHKQDLIDQKKQAAERTEWNKRILSAGGFSGAERKGKVTGSGDISSILDFITDIFEKYAAYRTLRRILGMFGGKRTRAGARERLTRRRSYQRARRIGRVLGRITGRGMESLKKLGQGSPDEPKPTASRVPIQSKPHLVLVSRNKVPSKPHFVLRSSKPSASNTQTATKVPSKPHFVLRSSKPNLGESLTPKEQKPVVSAETPKIPGEAKVQDSNLTKIGRHALSAGKFLGKTIIQQVPKVKGALVKAATKVGLKTAIGFVPILGQIQALGYAAYRTAIGDIPGAGLELAGMIPGLNVAANLALLTRDVVMAKDEEYMKQEEAGRNKAKAAYGKYLESLNDAYQVQAGIMPDSLKPLPTPESTNNKKLLDETKRSNENKLAPKTSGKVSVIDNSRTQTTAMKGKDDVVFGSKVNARNDDPTLSWISLKTTRQV